jgi:outer membrane protein OmpA-like peptidoglycan-associated protein
LLVAATLNTSISPFAAACELLAGFDQAVAARDIDGAKRIEARIVADATCGPYSLNARVRRASLQVSMAAELAARPGQETARERFLVEADEPDVLWTAAVLLGDLRAAQRRFLDAARSYDRAIEIIKNPSKTTAALSEPVILAVLEKAARAKILAANEEGARGAQYAEAARDFRDGTIGGLFSNDVRGVKPKRVPLPINFITATDKPTAIGRKAQAELLDAINEQRPSEIVIVGHTDERGDKAFNDRLSLARAQAIARFLASNGVSTPIKAIGRGFSDPIKDNTAGLSREDIWALNRRVEWHRP